MAASGLKSESRFFVGLIWYSLRRVPSLRAVSDETENFDCNFRHVCLKEIKWAPQLRERTEYVAAIYIHLILSAPAHYDQRSGAIQRTQ